MSFRLTYATMFNPPELMHERFDTALAVVAGCLGARHELHVDGRDVGTQAYADRRSPIDSERRLGEFAVPSRADVELAMRAAQDAFPAWRATPAAERVRSVRRIADVMEQRVYEIAAALALEVGKNRMEALGEAQEQAGQCGYCLAGILMRAKALMAAKPSPTRDDIVTALDGHLCRCGAHARMIRAIEQAASVGRVAP